MNRGRRQSILTQSSVIDRVRVTFLRLLLQLVSELHRRCVVDVEQRARLCDRLVGRGTRQLSLLQFITCLHAAAGVFVRYQRHIDGGGDGVCGWLHFESAD